MACLMVGDVISLDNNEYVVTLLNDSRARVEPVTKKLVSYETTFGKKVEFEASQSSVNISPNSEVTVLRRLGLNWRSKLDITTGLR